MGQKIRRSRQGVVLKGVRLVYNGPIGAFLLNTLQTQSFIDSRIISYRIWAVVHPIVIRKQVLLCIGSGGYDYLFQFPCPPIGHWVVQVVEALVQEEVAET